MTRTILMLAVVTLGCQPREGEACEPRDGTIRLAPEDCPPLGFSTPEPPRCHLVCTGPVGCDGPADFRWHLDADRASTWWCGCDGVTHSAPIDDGSHPTTRFVHWGSCDDPCWGVRLDLDGEPYWWDETRREVHPACTDCAQAFLGEEGECRHPLGFEIRNHCCRCRETDRWSEDGVCQRASGAPTAAFCCEAGE